MFYSITGTLICIDPCFAVIEAGGVGYKCTAPLSTLAALPGEGQKVTLYTHLYLREDIVELFGFLTMDELSMFRMLITVSGVGPKAAIAILSNGTPDRIALAIAAGDAKALKAPGIGPKITQRIIMELKDKVGTGTLSGAVSASAMPATAAAGPMTAQSEAVAALVALGYSQSEAASSVSRQDSALSTDQLIRGALRILAKGV